MRKSFTRLFSLVMFLTLLSSFVMAAVPTVKGTWPLDGSTKAWTKTTDKIKILYSEAVTASTGSIRVTTGSSLVRVLPATDSRLSFSGDTIVVDLSADLKELTAYTVSIDPSTFKTVKDGTAVTASSWMFTTGDYTGPTLKSVVPVAGTVVGSPTISLEMTFQDASPILLGTGNVALYKVDGNVWDLVDVATGTLTATGSDYKLTLTGIRTLEDNVNYAVTIGAGVVTDNGQRKDLKKNSFAGLTDRTVWVFSTKDYSAPVFSTDYPKKGTVTNNSASVLIKTTEPGTAYAAISTTTATITDITTTNGTTKKSVEITAAGTEYSINFSGLAENTVYQIHVVAKNADGVVSSTEKIVEVQTSETTAPKLVTTNGVIYLTGDTYSTTANVSSAGVVTLVPVHQDINKIVLDFDEDVKIGAGNIIIRKVIDNSDYITIPSTDLVVNSTDKSLVSFAITKAFENNAEYYVIVPNTLILDKFDNKYSGISATTGWRFTSNDVLTPTFTFTPAEGASAVKKNAVVKITFNELVQGVGSYVLGDIAGSTSPFELIDGTATLTFTTATSDNDGKFTTVTLTPSTNFGSSKVITIKIKANSISDASLNAILTEQGISFVVEDYVGPMIANDSNGNKWTVPSSTTGVLKVAFDEPIYLLGGGEVTNNNLSALMTLKQTDENGVNIPASYSIDADKKVITVTPSSPWASDGHYYAAITTDLQDMYGNAFLGATRTKTFIMGDVVPSTVNIEANSDDLNGQDINVSDAITFTFTEGSNPEAIGQVYYNGQWNVYSAGTSQLEKAIILKEGSATGKDVAFTVSEANPVFTIVPSIVGAKTYYLGIGSATKDNSTLGSGNINVAKFVTFTTKFAAAPTTTASQRIPADNATAVAKDAPVTIEFNCDVAVASTYSTTSSATSITINGASVALADVVVNGKIVTIKHAAFAANAAYDIVIPSGVIVNKNATSQVFAGVATTEWNFSTVDEAFTFTSLAPGGSNIAIDAKLVLAANEKFKKGVGYIYIKNSTTDALVEKIDVNSDQVVITDPSTTTSTATVTPSAAFKYGQAYYVELDKGAFTDLVGNQNDAKVGKTSSGAWTFTTVDSALAIVKVTPNNAEFVANNQSIVVEFNREIEAATGDIGFVEVAMVGGATQTETYTIGSTNITISGKLLTITHPDKLFPADSHIYLYLTAGSVKILGTSASVTLASDATRFNTLVNTAGTTYSFYTGNRLAPQATFSPAAFTSPAVYVDVNTNIGIQFNEEIFLNSSGLALTNGDVPNIFTLLEGTTTSVNCVGTISGRTVTLDPTSDLKENTEYTIQILGGSIKDVAGNTITSTNITSAFRTVDKTAPVLSGMTLSAVDGNHLDLVYSADDGINAAGVTNGNFTAFYYLTKLKSLAASPTQADVMAGTKLTAASGTVHIGSLTPSTAYEVFYVATDSRGNISTVAKLEASTTDTVAPTLVSTSPVSGAVNVNVDATDGITVKLTFNEPVQIGSTATITVRERTTQAILGTLTAGSLSTTTTDNKSLNLTIPTSIVSGTAAPVSLYVEIASGGSIKDQATLPNSFAGAFGPDAIYFTTEDNAAPTVLTSGTTTGTVALNSNITIKFSEEVQAGTGNAILYAGTVSATTAVQVFTASEVVFSGQSVTINPTADLTLGTSYIVALGDGFAFDKSANKNPNASTSSITFTASSDLAPIATVTPAGGSTAVDKAGIISGLAVSFSEAVYYPIAGYQKALLLMNETEIKNLVTFVNGAGTAIPFTITNKTATGFKVVPATAASILDQTAYKLTISGFQDNKAQVMTTKVEDYMTSDLLAPSITFNPVNKKTAVDPMASLTLTFSEMVYESVISANDNIFAYIDNLNVSSFVYLRTGSSTGTTSVDVPFTASISGLVITIKPTAKLESGIRYYYGLTRTVKDVNGTDVAAPTGVYFDAADYTVPTLLAIGSTNYAPYGTGVSATAPMWVKFSEPVVVSTGTITIRREDGTIFQTVSGADLTIKSDDATILKIAHNNFEPFTNYFVEVGASAVVDKSGNPNALFSDPTPAKGWLFTTNDTYALTASVSPNGENTPRSVNLEMTFNKVPTGVADKYIAVYKEDGTAVKQVEASSLTPIGKTIIIPVALDPNQSYYARVEPGAFKDRITSDPILYGGIMDNTWVFSTVDNIAPKVVTLAPADNATSVDTQATAFTMTFDRNIALGSGMIAVRYTVGGGLFDEVDVTKAVVNGMTLTFNVSKGLEANTDYYVIVPAGAITNTEVTKDPFAGILNIYTWNFTTATDLTAPTAMYTPNGTTTPTTDSHPSLQMTFNEDVTVAAGNVKVYKASDNTVVATIPVTAAMLSGKTVSLTYANGLERSTNYYVLVDAGVVKDLAGNAFAGVTASTTWTFKTGADWQTPVVPEISDSQFKVYPNPFVDYVTVSNASELSKVVVSNIAGQIVKEVVAPESTIQLNELRSGVYFITLYQDGAVIKTVKILKR